MGAYAFSYSVPKTQDQRLGVEGGMTGGQIAGPESNVANPGAIATKIGDFSSVTYSGNKYRMGLSGAEVKALLGEQTALFGQQVSQVTDFGKAALNAVTTGKTETGSLASLKDFVPLIVLGVIVVAALKNRRH